MKVNNFYDLKNFWLQLSRYYNMVPASHKARTVEYYKSKNKDFIYLMDNYERIISLIDDDEPLANTIRTDLEFIYNN